VDEPTLRALNDINRAFYREQAATFSATREDPWPGWNEVWACVESAALAERLDVVDVGCGNGRFARFLARQAPTLRYLGIDASPAMLTLAQARAPRATSVEFYCLDLVEEDLGAWLGRRRFTLAALFGVLHHVPGAERRHELVAALAERLRPGGLLALSSWQFGTFERFRSRILPWEEYNRRAAQPVDPKQLDAGDRLLRWGEGEALRYCHFTSEAETRELLESLRGEIIASFRADGREGDLNHYFVLQAGP
jgi:2-polyprenyl-3-methyl-5-hydroxy-6-metoxy-1,4-benzoquinol methylase